MEPIYVCPKGITNLPWEPSPKAVLSIACANPWSIGYIPTWWQHHL